jgi:hypothetical protein
MASHIGYIKLPREIRYCLQNVIIAGISTLLKADYPLVEFARTRLFDKTK